MDSGSEELVFFGVINELRLRVPFFVRLWRRWNVRHDNIRSQCSRFTRFLAAFFLTMALVSILAAVILLVSIYCISVWAYPEFRKRPTSLVKSTHFRPMRPPKHVQIASQYAERNDVAWGHLGSDTETFVPPSAV